MRNEYLEIVLRICIFFLFARVMKKKIRMFECKKYFFANLVIHGHFVFG